MRRCHLLFASALACLGLAALRAAPIRHEFLAIDEGLGNLLHVNENEPAKNWLVRIGKAHPRDMQLVGGGRLLISHDLGWSEYDVGTGKLLKDVAIYHDVSSARRLANGHTLLAGVDLDLPKQNKGGCSGRATGTADSSVESRFQASSMRGRRSAFRTGTR
jgi:hypothetical protein